MRSSTGLRGDWRRRRLLVIAGAGSGKINTLAHRVAHLIVRGAEPELLAEIEYRAESAESKSVFQGIKEGL